MTTTPDFFDNLFERVLAEQGITKEEWNAQKQRRMDELDKRLAQQWKDQQVTEELLNKRCTL